MGSYAQRIRALARGRAKPVDAHRRNAYQCPECGRFTVTVDVDDGTTPMFLGCRATDGCPGRAQSLGYPQPWPDNVPPIPTWEWYRPDPKAFRRLVAVGDATSDHLERGGLLIRRRPA